MMKTLRYFMMSALMLVAGAMYAQTTFDFAEANTLFNHEGSSSGTGDNYDAAGEFTADATATIGDFQVIVSASASDATTKNRIWATAPKLRLYNGTLTIKSTGAAIKRIDFTVGYNSNKKKNNWDAAASTGTVVDGDKLETWTGEAQEIVFTVNSNTQITKLVINGEGGSGDITPTPTEVEEISVAKALELCAALQPKATSADTYRIKGYVVEIQSYSKYIEGDANTYGNATFTMADAAGETDATKLFLAFRVKGFNNEKFIVDQDDALRVGDLVVVEAQLKNFATDNGNIYETNYGFIYTRNGEGAGVAAVKNAKAQNGVMYNLAGQVVNKGYKGLVIMNGRKFMNK